MKKGGSGPLFSCADPLSLLGEKIDEEVLAEVVGGGVEGPSVVDLGDLLDELDQVRVLAEHEDVQVDAAGRSASLMTCAASISTDRQMLYANLTTWKKA